MESNIFHFVFVFRTTILETDSISTSTAFSCVKIFTDLLNYYDTRTTRTGNKQIIYRENYYGPVYVIIYIINYVPIFFNGIQHFESISRIDL